MTLLAIASYSVECFISVVDGTIKSFAEVNDCTIYSLVVRAFSNLLF